MAWVEAVQQSPFRASGAAQPSLTQGKEAASAQAGSLVEAAPILASATEELWAAGSASATAALWAEKSVSATAALLALPTATWEVQLTGVARRRMPPAVWRERQPGGWL
jgi:hypothetical protein